MADKDTFWFRGVNMLDSYGIRAVVDDRLVPRPRENKVTIPRRSGTRWFDGRYYEDREIELRCDTMRGLTRAELRELAHLFGKKGALTLWNEPDKHYVAALKNAGVIEYLGMAGQTFSLLFECEPFAVGKTVTCAVPGKPRYGGTALTATKLTIVNLGTTAVAGVRVLIRKTM